MASADFDALGEAPAKGTCLPGQHELNPWEQPAQFILYLLVSFRSEVHNYAKVAPVATYIAVGIWTAVALGLFLCLWDWLRNDGAQWARLKPHVMKYFEPPPSALRDRVLEARQQAKPKPKAKAAK
eukprot:GGOE01018894.1.p3 GENE.GGOE01018894.1~~GGOE01018894.1.p3  ORF type:complete len:135 (-),score=37.18 GGOE01018894.1:356-733(-)